MTYQETTKLIAGYREQIATLRAEIRKAQSNIEPQPIGDYVFAATAGPVRLAELFKDKSDLFVILNMGTSCPYCTLWADGYNGIYHHLANRAAFVVASPDAPDVQARFAAARGWRFPMVSHAGTSFAADMGYRGADGRYHPGTSVFKKTARGVVRVSDTSFGPGDDFCALWHFLDMLPEGAAGWAPKFKYAA